MLPTAKESNVIVNFKSVKNTLMVYYEDESIDIVYTRDLLQFLLAPGRYKIPKDLPILQHIAAPDTPGLNKHTMVAQAKTQQSSMFMHVKEFNDAYYQRGNMLVVT